MTMDNSKFACREILVINLIALRKAKTPYSFCNCDCNRVNGETSGSSLTFFIKKMIIIQMYCTQKHCHHFAEICEELLHEELLQCETCHFVSKKF